MNQWKLTLMVFTRKLFGLVCQATTWNVRAVINYIICLWLSKNYHHFFNWWLDLYLYRKSSDMCAAVNSAFAATLHIQPQATSSSSHAVFGIRINVILEYFTQASWSSSWSNYEMFPASKPTKPHITQLLTGNYTHNTPSRKTLNKMFCSMDVC